MPRMSTGGNGTATEDLNYEHRPPKYKAPIFIGFARRNKPFFPLYIYGVLIDRWKILFAPPTKCLNSTSISKPDSNKLKFSKCRIFFPTE